MKFDAIVGNPPYQISGGSGGSNDAPIYQEFANTSIKIEPNYISLIMPSRWFSAGRENLLKEFRENMLNTGNLKKITTYLNGNDVFPSVEIKGGICYYLMDLSYNGECEYTLIENNKKEKTYRDLSQFNVLIREPKLSEIVTRVIKSNENKLMLDSMISNDTPFGIASNPKQSKKNPMKVYETSRGDMDIKLYYIEKLKRKVEYVERNKITKNTEFIEFYKVLIPGAGGSGNDSYVIGKPEFADKNSVCSQSYLFSWFNSKEETFNFIKYLKSKFLRVLVSSIKISQSAPKRVYRFVPLQDFTENSDIDWSKSIKEIDDQLYKKYNLDENEIAFIEEKVRAME